MLGLLAAAALAATACSRPQDDADRISPEEAVLEIRAEIARRRPAFRELVVRRYPAIHEKWAAERERTRIRRAD